MPGPPKGSQVRKRTTLGRLPWLLAGQNHALSVNRQWQLQLCIPSWLAKKRPFIRKRDPDGQFKIRSDTFFAMLAACTFVGPQNSRWTCHLGQKSGPRTRSLSLPQLNHRGAKRLNLQNARIGWISSLWAIHHGCAVMHSKFWLARQSLDNQFHSNAEPGSAYRITARLSLSVRLPDSRAERIPPNARIPRHLVHT